jgi:chaperonin GroES
MTIMPTQDNIIIRLPKVEKEKVTNSGIVLTVSGSQQDLPEQGVVEAIGEGRILSNGTIIAPKVSVGDKIIFNKFAGTKITTEDGEFLIIKENDILAIIK